MEEKVHALGAVFGAGGTRTLSYLELQGWWHGLDGRTTPFCLLQTRKKEDWQETHAERGRVWTGLAGISGFSHGSILHSAYKDTGGGGRKRETAREFKEFETLVGEGLSGSWRMFCDEFVVGSDIFRVTLVDGDPDHVFLNIFPESGKGFATPESIRTKENEEYCTHDARTSLKGRHRGVSTEDERTRGEFGGEFGVEEEMCFGFVTVRDQVLPEIRDHAGRKMVNISIMSSGQDRIIMGTQQFSRNRRGQVGVAFPESNRGLGLLEERGAQDAC
ncbi:hypothetical protein C8R43DRAFT_951861 [Mycena crocata]|nr:hypothetical protein C8R43DRAFT_951861 [Mycena crocata]